MAGVEQHAVLALDSAMLTVHTPERLKLDSG